VQEANRKADALEEEHRRRKEERQRTEQKKATETENTETENPDPWRNHLMVPFVSEVLKYSPTVSP
jgi:hypothetical protein